MDTKIILGIDPGTNVMGYGIISITGEKVKLIDFSDFSLKKLDNHYLNNAYVILFFCNLCAF